VSDYQHPVIQCPLHSTAAPLTVAPNSSFKPKPLRGSA